LLLELSVTLEIAAWLGAGRTLLLLILVGILGIGVLRRERLTILSQLRRAASVQEVFVPGLPDRALRALAGLLLIIPGFVSDAAALVLLLPRPRQWLMRRFLANFTHGPAGPTIIEGDFRRVDDPMLPPANQQDR
jgi:UPF0716 protein FxsA